MVRSPAGVSHPTYSKVRDSPLDHGQVTIRTGRVGPLDLHPSQTQNGGSFFWWASAVIYIFTRNRRFHHPSLMTRGGYSLEESLVDGDFFDLIFRYGPHHASIDSPPVAYSLTGHLLGRNGSSDEVCAPFD